MNTIRPSILPQTAPSSASGQDAAKLAAARAFFATALGQPQAPAATAPSAPSATAAPARAMATPTETPQKTLRPGSLIDIRV